MGYFFGADDEVASESTALWDGGSPTDPQAFDIRRDGLTAFELRREKPFVPLGGKPLGFYVGGELHLVEVSSDGATAIVLHQWPEEIGEPIEPA